MNEHCLSDDNFFFNLFLDDDLSWNLDGYQFYLTIARWRIVTTIVMNDDRFDHYNFFFEDYFHRHLNRHNLKLVAFSRSDVLGRSILPFKNYLHWNLNWNKNFLLNHNFYYHFFLNDHLPNYFPYYFNRSLHFNHLCHFDQDLHWHLNWN